MKQTVCPGCRVRMPEVATKYTGYYHCSDECWSVYSDVLGAQFSNVLIFNQAHQVTVDAYAVQHAGGRHKNKSIAIHLTGLHLAIVEQVVPRQIPGMLQQLDSRTVQWPDFPVPRSCGPLTIVQLALASTPQEHVSRANKWARFVWQAWEQHHDAIARLARRIRQ